MSCKEVFTEAERKHLEEVLRGDLDGYWEEIKDIDPNDADFEKWKNFSNTMLKKCDLNEWDVLPDGFPEKVKKMDLKEAEVLVWKEILQEDKESFTPEFRKNVLKTIKNIMERS